jgi:LytS/YehU family sensor histidine kinase
MHPRPTPTQRRTFAVAFAALIAVVCGALLAAAALVPAPPAALPVVIVACIGAPMAATYELACALAAVREPSAELRRQLDALPETPHPHGY